jgi:hypothetical protein
MNLRLASVLSAGVLLGLPCRGSGQGTLACTFGDATDLARASVQGQAVIDPGRDHTGNGGGALALPPGAVVGWTLRERNGSGTVDLWVFDDGKAPADAKAYASGPLWGLVQADGLAVVVGPVYAPYLTGDKTYAASDTAFADPAARPWQQVQYLGTPRRAEWHRWTFVFDAAGLRILCDGQDVNARQPVFNWNRTRLRGFCGIVLRGDASGAGQTLWVDDVSAALGEEGEQQPLWPPPPPADLVVVPPPAPPLASPWGRWPKGVGRDPNQFPIGVWLQDPKNAARFREAGINLYIGLWKGPTDAQMDALRAAGMPVICDQNEVGLRRVADEIIVGWMHGDEPDNAQPLPEGKGWGPPVPPATIVANYQRLAERDPSRPVLLNLGQGVAWDQWHGRGVRTNHPEDYAEYVRGADIVSFDIYPSTHERDTVRGNLWYVGRGVSRLRQWTRDERVVWAVLECTRISNPELKPSPDQVRAEAWMALVHGCRGLLYFVHQFKPRFAEAALLEDAEMLAAVTALNRQIQELAPVLNRPTVPDGVLVTSSSPHTPVHAVVKRTEAGAWLFAVAMYREETTAEFRVAGLTGEGTATVLGEDREITMRGGCFSDRFAGYGVHLYRLK